MRVCRRGVENVISLVVLVSVVVVLSIVAARWIMSSVQTTEQAFIVQPKVFVYNKSLVGGSAPELYLHVSNEGNREAVIVMVEIRTDNGSWVNKSRIVVPAGSEDTIVIRNWEWVGSGSPPVLHRGDKLRVVVYTERYGPLFFDVIVS